MSEDTPITKEMVDARFRDTEGARYTRLALALSIMANVVLAIALYQTRAVLDTCIWALDHIQ